MVVIIQKIASIDTIGFLCVCLLSHQPSSGLLWYLFLTVNDSKTKRYNENGFMRDSQTRGEITERQF